MWNACRMELISLGRVRTRVSEKRRLIYTLPGSLLCLHLVCFIYVALVAVPFEALPPLAFVSNVLACPELAVASDMCH